MRVPNAVRVPLTSAPIISVCVNIAGIGGGVGVGVSSSIWRALYINCSSNSFRYQSGLHSDKTAESSLAPRVLARMNKAAPPPETLGSVPLNGGQSSTGKPYGGQMVNGKFVPNAVGELRREVCPDGKIVEHRVRKSIYVHERLHNLTGPQKLADELYDAAEKFRQDFERAQLSGNYARMDLFKARSGRQEMSDNVAMAKVRIDKALDALGNGSGAASLSQSCIWNVVGLGATLEAWTALIKAGGGAMNADRASGVFHVSLERLAIGYGMLNESRLQAMAQDQAYSRGIKDSMDFVNVFASTAQGPEKNALGRMIAAMQKRFAKFA
jgi:hypothetical protein